MAPTGEGLHSFRFYYDNMGKHKYILSVLPIVER